MDLLMHCILVIVSTSCIKGTTVNEIDRLSQDLLQHYAKNIRPPYNNSEPIVVYVTFFLRCVSYYDDVGGVMSVVGGPIVMWHDYRLMWNPTNYSNIVSITVPRSEIWYPDLFAINTAVALRPLAEGKPSEVFILPNGYVSMLLGDQIVFICPGDMTYFPFDLQVCNIRLADWNFFTQGVFLQSAVPKIDMSYFTPSNVWNVDDTSSGQHEEGRFTGMVEIQLRLRRKPLYFCLSMLAPFMFLAILNPLVFILPADSGERISFSVTIFLSFVVFMTLISQALPKTSEPMPIVSYILLTVILYSALIIVITIINLRLYRRETENNRKMEMFANILNLKCFRTTSCRKNKVTNEKEDNVKVMDEKEALNKSNESKSGSQLAREFDIIAFVYSYIFVFIIGLTCVINIFSAP